MKETGERKSVESLTPSEIRLYYGLLLTDQLELENTSEEDALIQSFVKLVTENKVEETFTPPKITVLSPLDKVAIAPLTKENQLILGNSRAKKVYLFDAKGEPTQKKTEAVYMVDTGMDQTEQENYEKARKMGVRVPEVYGHTKAGHPIVQWLARQTTAGGAGSKPPLVAVRQKMNLDNIILKKTFPTEKWKRTLADVKKMIELNYTSTDLQFMIDDDTGEAYIMDLESNNAPKIGFSPDRRLLELEEFLERSIEKGAPAL